ncbi:MAG: SDR family oxidoreductase [Streptosporangiales bacterium]|nr:SDR family oxidoreductase [Streptosporangiales bacterium]
MTVAVVTGGARGIGAAIVEALRADGTRCVVADVQRPDVPLDGVDYVECDLATAAGVEVLLDELGVAQVDQLVHCAAVLHYAPFLETSRTEWERVLQVDLHAAIAVTQAVVPLMTDGGRIVFFASGTVFKGPQNMFAYVAAKAGVIGFARCLATELGDRGINVHVVSPGLTATPMVESMAHTEEANIATRAIKRRAYPDDIVGPVRFLLSDDARFVTGQTLCVDGGSVLH